MADEILFFSRFVLDETAGGGGCKREAQLGQALLPLNYKFISTGESLWMKNQVHGIKNLLFRLAKKYHPYKKYWIDFFQDTMFRMRAQAIDWKKLVARSKALKCVIIDDPIYFYPLVEYLTRRKIPIVGLCHNIESLSYSQLKSGSQLELFQKEIELLKKCALVVTISRQETFLLKNFAIPTYYLPYHPVASIEQRMLKVRQRRQSGRKKGYLLLGTVGNKVTLDGMKAFIQFWKNSKNKNKKEKLLVAGFWTKRLLHEEPGENVELLGTPSNEELDDILSRVKAMFCYQEYGSGALTKIKEMLIAGVPVIANAHAARSYHGNAGVIEFTGLENIHEAMARIAGQRIPIPDTRAAVQADRELVARIKELL